MSPETVLSAEDLSDLVTIVSPGSVGTPNPEGFTATILRGIIARHVNAAKAEFAKELEELAESFTAHSNQVSRFIDADHAEDVHALARRYRLAGATPAVSLEAAHD